ncbi:MAG: choice-of-anchor I family protein [Planctomycetia bacterium]|nr:choice-of-anchor I family protein [Planctomycetia bacterium]
MRFLIHTLMLGLALLSFTETYAQGTGSVNLTPISTFNSGVFEGSASEIVAYDPISGRVFVTNATAGGFDILQLSQTGQLGFVTSIATSRPPTHLRIWNDGITSHVVASIPSLPITNPGTVQVFSTSGVLEAVYSVGAFPDMLYITSDGRALTANEGQPIGGTNPRGSVSIVHLATGVVEHISFTGFDGQEVALRNSGIRIFPGFSASVDLEPEYIAVSGDLNFAYAICQEQNCVITIDLTTSTPIRIDSLGKKNHLLPGNGLDPSDSNGVSINTWPVSGLYQPDSIVAFEAAGIPYLLTANEGAARTEDARARTLQLDPGAFPNAGFLQANSRIGRLQVSTIDGDIDGDGDFDELVAYGTRSFSIFEMTTGADIVYDSGDEFALVTSQAAPGNFNSNSTSNNSADGRSDNKGCEPEAATVAHIGNQILAFIGLERQGGIMVFYVTDPPNSFFLGYFTNLTFNSNF